MNVRIHRDGETYIVRCGKEEQAFAKFQDATAFAEMKAREQSLAYIELRVGALRRPGKQPRLVRANGKVRSISEWSRVSGLSRQTIMNRLRQGWDPDKAVTVPTKG